MRRVTFFIASLLLPCFVQGQERVSIRAERLLDGAGNVLENRTVTVEGGKIREVSSGGGAADYTLTGLTVLPGLIDTHVHIASHFDPDDRVHREESVETPQENALYAAENAYKTLMAGITTVQSLGNLVDKPVRDAIARGALPGPRILTSLESIFVTTGSPDAMRAFVRKQKSQGADLIKIFASESIRDGGGATLSQEQLDAACGEAKALGLRSVVHAHGPESARRAVAASCNVIEHGALLDAETLSLMAEKGLFFDPHTHLIFQNYFDNKARYLGTGNYTEEGFRHMEKAVPSVLQVFKTGLTMPKLKMVFGTDAVAGAHGRNVEEL
ncbi:MAG TPA: amidohydrolase family protein, partial [Vicinamibacteria bacterium]